MTFLLVVLYALAAYVVILGLILAHLRWAVSRTRRDAEVREANFAARVLRAHKAELAELEREARR